MKVFRSVAAFSILLYSLLFPPSLPAHAQAGDAVLEVLDRQGQISAQITDGDQVSLRFTLSEAAAQETAVSFRLASSGLEVAGCTVAQGESGCQSEAFGTTGWYWDPGGSANPAREVEALVDGQVAASTSLQVGPRPVVFVHGFSADWRTWTNYLGPQGYLASVGMSGFAVGDGQGPGAMNTGSFVAPTGQTNTIAQNAQVVGEYIAKVKELTGAQRVDLVAHSMGGLISRYYIDRVMPEGEVAQLVMLGSPMLGTECANLPAALGFYLPATLEIQPVYVQNIFNTQITERRGVIFHALAGDPISDAIQSPCTPVPTDLAVSLQSVSGIPLILSKMPVLHTALNVSEQVFREYLLPILQTPAGGFTQPADPGAASERLETLQFTRVYTGQLGMGETQDLTIPIEPNVSVASFALFDSSRSLQVEVYGASGNLITLDPVANGLIQVDDPQSMLTLGYGFNNPKPGVWRVKLLSSVETPAEGADYALTAVFRGGAVLEASTNTLLPKIGEAVDIDAALSLDGSKLPVEQAVVIVHGPDGSVETVDMVLQEDAQVQTASWEPRQAGLYGLEVRTSGNTPDGFAVERSAFLVIEAQPGSALTTRSAILVGTGTVLLIGLGFGLLVRRVRRRRRVLV